MYNKNEKNRTTRPKTVRRNNVVITVPLYTKGMNHNKRTYELDSLTSILTFSETFEKFSIPLYAYRDEIIEPENKGFVQVGYINSYDEIGATFDVTVYEKFADQISDLGKIVIYPRVLIENNHVIKIIGFDICKADRY